MDTIIINGKILQEDGSFVEALAIENGYISATGTNTEIKALQTDETEVIDANRQLVLPGLNDSHLHFHMLGNFLSSVNLYGLTSIEAIIEKGREFIATHDLLDNQTIIGMGWNQDYFEGEQRMPTRHDLDKISTEYPLIFKRACIHVTVCNTKALEILGITADTPAIEGGDFELGEDEQPNGIFKENAQRLVKVLEPEVSMETVKANIMMAANHAIASGLTSVQVNDLSREYAEFPYIMQAYQELAETGELPLHVYMQCCFSEPESFREFIEQGYYTGYGDTRFKVGPLKMFADGSLGARTSLMRAPYHDDPSTKGVECLTQEQLNTMVEMADNNNFQVIVHAIGDQAICNVLESYERVYDKATNNPLRHGINHCQITDIPMLERFRDSNVLAYLQPIFLHYDLHMVEDRVGKELASTSYAFKTMEDLGIITSYGTDAPVEDLNPFDCIYCAVTRQDLKGYPEGGFYPNECVDVATAIDRYTKGSAYFSFEEDIKGTLTPGKLADLVIVDQDLYTIPANQIKDTSAWLTMVEGEIVYQK